jgi:putative ABC transport system permease protein
VGQLLPALVGALLGLPGGIALISVVDDDPTFTPVWQLLALVPLTVLAVAALTAVPARLAGRRPVAEILRAERA